ncbi:MAG: hypothetical protein NTY80_04770 [candidate division SR1 bacterium]|nr:hypothetical protein [candidate division SR1 bacterium]
MPILVINILKDIASKKDKGNSETITLDASKDQLPGGKITLWKISNTDGKSRNKAIKREERVRKINNEAEKNDLNIDKNCSCKTRKNEINKKTMEEIISKIEST